MIIVVGKSVSQKLTTFKFDQFSEKLKTNCTWLTLLVAELSVLHGLFNKRTIWKETFLKSESGEKSEQKPLALSCLRCSYTIAGLWVTMSFPLHFKFDEFHV